MLINLRNALMAGKRLPYDAEVEYLESTGTQWIDTGIIGGSSSKVEISASSSGVAQNMGIFGSRNASFLKSFTILPRVSYTRVCFDFADNAANRAIANAMWDTSGVNIVIKDGPNNMLNGVAGANNATATFTCEYPFYLFGINTAGAATLNADACVYSCKIWDNGVLVRDYIPVRKGTVGYLYDRVTGKLFGNAGTGDFVLGQDVVPVEYIESHGTEWIGAGFNITNAQSFAYDVKFDLAQTITNAQPRLISNEGAGAGNYYDIYYALNALRIRQAGAVIGNVLRDVPIVARMTEQGRYYGYYESSPESLLWDVTRAFTTPTVQMNYKIFDRANYNQEQYRWQGKAYYMHFTKDGVPIRSFRPIRVGTDATSWEGAMMDVLTRRIYRNAGTGAFAYGNDLKYPIPAE